MRHLLHEPESLAHDDERHPEQAQADDAITYDHNGGENCVAGQTCLFRRSSNHDGDDQSDLNDCDGDSEDKCAERLAGSMGDYLGVINGRENSSDKGCSRRRINQPAPDKGRHQ